MCNVIPTARWVLTGYLLLSACASWAEGVDKGAESVAATEAADEIASLRQEGLEHLRRGEITQAIKKLGRARAKGADDPELRLGLGRAYLAREMFQKALIEFSAVIRDDPNQVEANLGRAESLIGLGDAKKAVGPAKLVTDIEPENVRAWLVLGNAHAHPQAQDYEKAQAAYRRALELEPANREAGMNLARALNFEKKVEEAIQVMEKVRQDHPDDMSIVVRLAESYYAIRKLDKAEELVHQALEVDPQDKEARRVLGQIESRQAYNFWVPVIALIAFPLVYLAIRWMRKGRVPKVKDA